MTQGGRDFKSLAAFVSKETGATVKAGFKPSQVQKPDPVRARAQNKWLMIPL